MTHRKTNKLARALALVALLGALGAAALVAPARGLDPHAPETLARLLERPIDAMPGAPAESRPSFWKALLASPLVEPVEGGLRLDLGRVLADPSAARGSAESAGELLELEAQLETEGEDVPLGVPLWRAILERAAVSEGTGRTLSIYGCRHLADADAAPSLEDTYHARLAMVRRLRELGNADGAAGPLAIRGEQAPVKGGINLEVVLQGERQSLRVTFDGSPQAALRVERAHRPPAPNDARARANLVAALEALALREPGLGELTLEGRDGPADGGVEMRFESYGGRLALTARRGSARLATHLTLLEPEEETPAKEPAETPPPSDPPAK